MEKTNLIRDRYKELIRLVSLIGDEVRIDDRLRNNLTIHIFKDGKMYLVFDLSVCSENSNSIDIQWKISDSIGYIGSECFPDFFSPQRIFNKLICRITEWEQDVLSRNFDTSLRQAQAIENRIKKTFVRDWTLIDFTRQFGKMQVGTAMNHTTGETFPICRFIDEHGISTYAGFYSRLGSLTNEQIQERKHKLFVGQASNGKYYLHDNRINKIEDVDLN